MQLFSIHTIRKFFTEGHPRSLRAKKNIAAAFLIKGGSILVSFLLVPLTLGYLNSYDYGIWLTLSSILGWISFFDIGLGNGLKNKLSEALAANNKFLARIYVSTTLFMLIALMTFIYLVFFVVQNWLDWNKILNAPSNNISNLNTLVTIVVGLFCMSFVFKFVGIIYMANQIPVINDFMNFLGNILSLLIIFILKYTTKGDLAKVAICFSLAPLIIYILAYPFTFYKKYNYLRPKISSVQLKYAKDLMGLGFKFFIIQIAYLIMFTTSNILISHLFGPQEVTPYNIAFKYFSIITMVFGILIAPMWTAMTEAYVKQDITWIKNAIKKIKKIWLILIFITIVMILVSNLVYKVWVGKEIKVSLSLSFFMGIYTTIFNYNNIFSNFIGGIGKIRVILFISIFTAMIFLPLAWGMSMLLGVQGIIIASSLTLLPGSFFETIQWKKIINNNATGIWLK